MTSGSLRPLALTVLLLASAGWPSPALAAERGRLQPAAPGANAEQHAERELADYIRSHYTKHEHRIPMRDGKRLHTAIYLPKDASRAYAILMQRTPYSVAPYGVDRYRERLGPSELLARRGFVFVYQDVRGRFLSEGDFVEMTPHRPDKRAPSDVDESTDTWDTIEWLLAHVPNHNGRVGMWGISYPGFYAAAGMIDAHPALRAVSPQAPIGDLYLGDDCYHGGAFMLAANFDFFTRFAPQQNPTLPVEAPEFDYGTTDGYEFFLAMGALENADELYFRGEVPYWSDLLEHTVYDDFWQRRAIVPHLERVAPAVLVVGGWYDAEDLQGPLSVYASIEEKNPGVANHLVMGPWTHGGWSGGEGDRLGDLDFGSDTAEFYRERIELPFFESQLYGDGALDLPEAWIFETGTDQWRRHDAWPPAEARARRLRLGPGGLLLVDGAGEGTHVATTRQLGAGSVLGQPSPLDPPATGDPGFDEYRSDPARPVPFVPYPAIGMPDEYMAADQRFAARRPDVLVYESEPLERDLAIAGPIGVDLWVSTTGTDADFVVKLIDVHPADYPDPDPGDAMPMGGFARLVRGEPFRAKFREGFTEPQPMTPGEPARVRFAMPDVSHVFRRGHRVAIHVQSSWFPLIDRNPQTFTHIPTAAPEDFRPAIQRVHRTEEMPSAIEVLVLESPL